MYNTVELCELSSLMNGANILFASDDFFGTAGNLLQEKEPNIDTEGVTCRSPYQDAWITRRKRSQNCDFVIIQLAAKATIHFVCIDTANLFGNVALKFSIQASLLRIDNPQAYQNYFNNAGRDVIEHQSYINQLHSETWPFLIPKKSLNPGFSSMNKKLFMISSTEQEYTHLRLNIFPDGGISRLRVFGKVSRPTPMPSLESHIDLVSQIYGGNCIAYSSCYNNTHPNNLITSVFTSQGWQTARSLSRSTTGFSDDYFLSNFNEIVGEEWAIFKLGYSGKIISINFDTTYFKGDSPYIVQVKGLKHGIIINDRTDINDKPWQTIVPYIHVNEGSNQLFTSENQNMKMAYVKLSIKPDGCVTKFRVLGKID